MPFRQFLLKVHGRCNLACDHCYVFTLADQSWRVKPRAMSPDVVACSIARIGEHARRHRLSTVRVVLHGGEPLLVGAARLGEIAAAMRAAIGPDARVDLSIQTNGTLLTRSMLDVLAEQDVRVGVSLDGDRAANDRHRRRHDGSSSFDLVRRGLRLLGRADYRSLYGGLLCTVDLTNEPVRTYEALLEHDPPAIDFLLPNANWSTPPPGSTPSGSEYGDWLVAVFDRWYSAPRRETTVRLFDEIIALLLGGRGGTEGIGSAPIDLVVVDTDGSIEQSDALKGAFPDAPATGLTVQRNSFDQALALPEFRAGDRGAETLAGPCRRCPVVRVCGGGLLAHRYESSTGFDNPSVYCHDLLRLIEHIHGRLSADVERLRCTTS